MNTITQITDTLDQKLGDVIDTDPLSALAAVNTVRTVVARREREAVMAALVDHTFREIGDVLGVSKQAIFQRFGKDWVVSRKVQMAKPEWN